VSAAALAEIAGLHLQLRQAAPIPLDAAFACAPGEVLALVGPSGSGKSTILRAIAGHYRPQAGRIAVNGRLWYDTQARIDLPPHRRRAGLVFQSYALFPHMTAYANVTAALGHMPATDRAGRVAELLDLVHLTGLEQRRPAELSGGQQQRVAVARALARDPEVLLLDEPFSAVDKTTRQKLYRELAEMRRRLAMPVILVTHDLDEATMLADRMVLLQRGRTMQDGPPVELMLRPASVAAARLVGLRNLFTGRLERPATDGALGLLSWRDRLLDVARTNPYAAGMSVAWLVPPGGVVLHRRDRPSRGERENPVAGRVIEFLRLADQAAITMQIDDDPELPLAFTVPWHTAVRNGVGIDATITVSLLAEAIHLLPTDRTGDPP
jgi:molybdate transport system ATP-binding protein